MRKRIVALALVVISAFVGITGRTVYIFFNDDYTAGSGYNSYSLVVDRMIPTLYYSGYEKMTNDSTDYVAVIRPTVKCIGELSKLFDYQEEREILEELKGGKPILIPIKDNPKTNYIGIYKTAATSKRKIQLISSVSSGLESYIQNESGEMRINFNIDALGRLLSGDAGSIEYMNYDEKYGYVMTIDKDIQKITENACAGMRSGAAMVMDANNGAILSCVTKPDDTYLNKPLCQYAVGSVFKTVVAACAIENDIMPAYKCVGSITVGDTVFSCSHDSKHGRQNLKDAFANSCNCYFVNLALELGSSKLLKTSKDLGFNNKTKFFSNWNIVNAHLPSEDALLSKGQLALLGFGQGSLTATPMQICSVMCAVANDGIAVYPHIIKSKIDHEGEETKADIPAGKRVISSKTAKRMIDCMRAVVTRGTGIAAESTDSKSCGKTATAQTGQFEYGREKLNTWFAGVYPYDNPKYAIVIMDDDGISGSRDCCPVFRTIVENIE